MTKTARVARKTRETSVADWRFMSVVVAFANDQQVRHKAGKGVGSGALKVHGKIFAMISSTGRFLVTLPKERVDDLVTRGAGDRFDPGTSRSCVRFGTALAIL